MGTMLPLVRPVAALSLLALASCGGSNGDGAVDSAGTEALTGRYESGAGPRRNQLCLIERQGAAGSFGLVQWGTGDASCSFSGSVRRDGDRLSLLLDGDQACVVEARAQGDQVVIPDGLSSECARYYCGPGADLRGAEFQQVASGEAEATHAADLAGDPLCAG